MSERLLKYLVSQGLISQELADRLRREQDESGKSIREQLSESGAVSEEQLLDALAAVSRLPVIRLYEQQIPLELRQLVRPDLLREHVVLPFAFDPEDPNIIWVAMNDPMNLRGRDLVAVSAKCRVKPFLATTSDILVTIDRHYGTDEMRQAAEQSARGNEIDSSL